MHSVILGSIVLMTFALPLYTARDRNPARGMRRTIVGTAIFIALYVIGVTYVLARFS